MELGGRFGAIVPSPHTTPLPPSQGSSSWGSAPAQGMEHMLSLAPDWLHNGDGGGDSSSPSSIARAGVMTKAAASLLLRGQARAKASTCSMKTRAPAGAAMVS